MQILGFVSDFKSWMPFAVMECEKRNLMYEHGSSMLNDPETFKSNSERQRKRQSELDIDDARNSRRLKTIVVPVQFLLGCAWIDYLDKEECEKKLKKAFELDQETRIKKMQLEDLQQAGGAFESMKINKLFAEAEDKLRRKNWGLPIRVTIIT